MISSNSSAGETGETVSETVVPDPAPRPVRHSFTAASRDDRRGVRGGPSWGKGRDAAQGGAVSLPYQGMDCTP